MRARNMLDSRPIGGLLLSLATLAGMASGCLPEDGPPSPPPPADCGLEAQNQFVVDVMADYYLWSDEVPTDVDITAFEDPNDLVKELRAEDDRWTRIADKATSDALFMEGKFVGLGYKTQRMEDDSIRISFVSDNSPASAAGILRGDTIVGVGGYTVAELDEMDLWSQVYGENDPGVEVEIEIAHFASGETLEHTIVKDWIDIVSLPVVEVFDTADGPVGYYVMDKFVETTKAELDGAYQQFKDAGADTVIIDLRYNGGGLISVAARTVSLTLGADHGGELAYQILFNDFLAEENSSTDIDDRDESIGADEIIVLVSSRTLSASELVINALFPYANVTLIGSDTGGKPVGSRSYEFCEKKLYPISFRLVNADGATDYFDGLSADCFAGDDLDHQLGDPDEAMLAAALAYLGDGSCSLPAPAPAPGMGDATAPLQAVGERVLPNADARDDIDSW